nr:MULTISPECIES: hypothetical protein [unclassified Pseudonocardia]
MAARGSEVLLLDRSVRATPTAPRTARAASTAGPSPDPVRATDRGADTFGRGPTGPARGLPRPTAVVLPLFGFSERPDAGHVSPA